MALQTTPEEKTSKLTRFTFDARINIPTAMLRQEECRVPFIVAHGPRSIEFEFKINIADVRQEDPTLLVDCQSELRMQIPGLITIRFGASKDADNAAAAEILTNETQETDFEHTFIMRGVEPLLESLRNTITSAEYENGLIGFSILMTYQETEFMQFVEQKSRLRPLTYIEIQNYHINTKANRDFVVYSSDSYFMPYPKWMLYISTKYFHNLIDQNPTIHQATLNFPHDVIIHAISLALQNQFQQGFQKDIRKKCQTIELLCILEPINVDIAIENVAIELESSIFDEWKYIDLDDLVRILTLPKYWELEEMKVAARSVIIDLHNKQFQ
uniref:BTB domain-containing protein n=1 Tax=Elaeophora elaphi TaxID=1147741 RepID=A0A0R3RKK7_9BILA